MAGKGKGRGKLRPPVRFTVAESAGFLSELKTRLESGKRLRIDLSRVEHVDTAALQLLAVVSRAALAEGRACEILGASESVRDDMSLLGLESLLGSAAPGREAVAP